MHSINTQKLDEHSQKCQKLEQNKIKAKNKSIKSSKATILKVMNVISATAERSLHENF